jgi:hypothetical protein
VGEDVEAQSTNERKAAELKEKVIMDGTVKKSDSWSS